MTDKKIIKGSGGAPPSPPTPYRAPDTLHSRQFGTFLDLISEGEIEGFATASKEGRTKGTAVSAIGAAMVLNGVSEMLFPMPKPERPEDDPRISFNFSGVQNTSRAGTAHPIVYGEVITGSVVISAGIDTNQVTA